MTKEEFSKVRPGKTIVKVKTNEGSKTMLVKYFLCNQYDFDGYWMRCTEDITNPYPYEYRDEDWDVYANNCEIIKY